MSCERFALIAGTLAFIMIAAVVSALVDRVRHRGDPGVADWFSIIAVSVFAALIILSIFDCEGQA